MLCEKYESLKRKFAITVKEKEQLEQNKLLETAKFKDLGEKSGHASVKNDSGVHVSEFKESNSNCNKCGSLENAIYKLADKYKQLISQLREDLLVVKQESKE